MAMPNSSEFSNFNLARPPSHQVSPSDIEQREVIPIHMCESCLGFVGRPKGILGPQPHRQRDQHSGDGQGLVTSAVYRRIYADETSWGFDH